MRAFLIVLLQVVMAVLVAGAIMPALLVSVPETREAGPLVFAGLMAVLFVLLRLVWPARKT